MAAACIFCKIIKGTLTSPQNIINTTDTTMQHHRRDPFDETLRKRQSLCFPRHQPFELRPRC
jgi:diadenosine tetraphosphate (Ap4A) HIT family hydrolase